MRCAASSAVLTFCTSGLPPFPRPALPTSYTLVAVLRGPAILRSLSRFNNAGTGTPPVPFDEITYEDWMGCVQTNLTGSFLCAQQAFRMMKSQTPQGGRYSI